MLIHDLSHFEVLSQSPNIFGGIDDLFNIFLDKDGHLRLTLGDQELYSTTLTAVPKRIALSVDGFPGFTTSTSTQNINGKVRSILTVGFGGAQVGGGFSFASASTTTLL